MLAAVCLQLFAQSNWTGPAVSIALADLLAPPAALSSQLEPSPLAPAHQPPSLVEVVHSCLLLDGESVYSLVSNPLLLLLARVILVKASSRMGSLQVGVSSPRLPSALIGSKRKQSWI